MIGKLIAFRVLKNTSLKTTNKFCRELYDIQIDKRCNPDDKASLQHRSSAPGEIQRRVLRKGCHARRRRRAKAIGFIRRIVIALALSSVKFKYYLFL